MKRIYWVGDMLNNTGPAIVNKSYYPFLKEQVVFCFTNNKLLRTVHFLLHLFNKKTIVISGFSKLNYYYSKIAKKFKKNVVYLMHGYIKLENKFLENRNIEKEKIEYRLLKSVDKVICVSELFCDYLKNELPEFKNKINFVNNGIIELGQKNKKRKNKEYVIISVGGGIRQKNNLVVCSAIEKLKIKDVKFIVIGKMGAYGEEITSFDFVEYYESLSHEEVLEKFVESDLYIQNSYFETFGLSVVEALQCGCDLLISKNVGALSILKNITNHDIIDEVDSIDEIFAKIQVKIQHKSNIIYDTDTCSWSNRSRELLKSVSE